MNRPYTPILGRKQSADNATFKAVWGRIGAIVPRGYIQDLVAMAADAIRAACAGKRAAFAWSGGKDSSALHIACREAGIDACVMGLCELEYPAFLRWVTDNMPHELEAINTGQDIHWLAAHREMLFPQDAKTAAKWFKIIQHKAQAVYYKRHHLDLILLGRRHGDGNYTGRDGTGIYTARGITRFSPIRFWTHEDVLAAIHYYDYPLAPIYAWPNGFVVGTGAWPARQWTGSIRGGWREVYQIDPHIVTQAAEHLPSAEAFLREAA